MKQSTGYHLLINAQSGAASKLGNEGIEAALHSSELNIESLQFLEPDELESTLESLDGTKNPILIGGGDGTIMKAADQMMRAGKAFGFLPMGTMNLLAQDLDIPVSLPEAFQAFANGCTQISIDVATVNDIPFLCCAGIGVMPEASILREEHRGESPFLLIPRLTMFVFNQLDHLKRRPFRLMMDKRVRHLKTTSLVISNNAFALPEEMPGTAAFRKITLQDGRLGVYAAVPRSAWDRIRLMMRLHTGAWKNDPVIKEYTAHSVTVFSHEKEEIVSLDGENHTFKTPLRFRILPKALNLLVPAQEKTLH